MAGLDWPPVPAIRAEDMDGWRLRALMLAPTLRAVMAGAEPMPGFNHGIANSVASRFVRELPLKVGMERARDGSDIRRLEGADEVWSLCARYKGPGGKGWRILGRFIERDIFIGLTHAPRICLWPPMEEMIFRDVLQRWERTFPGVEPLRGTTPTDYMERVNDA
jgi:hypothetical protein